jgi:hypothetical protein
MLCFSNPANNCLSDKKVGPGHHDNQFDYICNILGQDQSSPDTSNNTLVDVVITPFNNRDYQVLRDSSHFIFLGLVLIGRHHLFLFINTKPVFLIYQYHS